MMDFDAQEQLAEERRRRFAAQLAGAQQAPQGQMVGRHFVAPSFLQYAAQALRGVGGMRGEQLAEQELGQIRQQRTEGTNKALADFLRMSQGTPENAPGDGMGPTMPAQAPDMRGAYSALMQAPDAGLRQAGMQGQLSMAQQQAQATQQAAERQRKTQALQTLGPVEAVRQGIVTLQEAEGFANAQNIGVPKVARTVEVAGPNGEKLIQSFDDRGNAIGQPVPAYMAPVQVNRGNVIEFVTPTSGQSFSVDRGPSATSQPYFQFIGTPQGIVRANARTGELSLGTINGQNVVRASDDPTLQGQISGSRTGASEATKRVIESGMDAPQAIQQAQNSLTLLDDLLKHPGLGSSVGVERIAPLRLIPGTPQADFESRLGQIQGQSFLQAFESLKGGGQITEIEGQKATQAINRMSAATSEREFRTAVSDLQQVLRQGISRAERAQQRLQNNLPAGVDLSPRPGNIPAGAQPLPTARSLSAQDQQALNWARANPNDPRSAAIMQRLGAQ